MYVCTSSDNNHFANTPRSDPEVKARKEERRNARHCLMVKFAGCTEGPTEIKWRGATCQAGRFYTCSMSIVSIYSVTSGAWKSFSLFFSSAISFYLYRVDAMVLMPWPISRGFSSARNAIAMFSAANFSPSKFIHVVRSDMGRDEVWRN